jgi:hypothetical protein
MTIALAAGSVAVAGAQSRWGYQDPYYGQRPYDNRGGYYGGDYGDRYGMRGGPAYQFGLEDGRRDGERDFYTRHSFRPEEHGNFRHADRGYSRRFGDKRYYKDQYRAGYMEGYRMAYRGGGGWRR